MHLPSNYLRNFLPDKHSKCFSSNCDTVQTNYRAIESHNPGHEKCKTVVTNEQLVQRVEEGDVEACQRDDSPRSGSRSPFSGLREDGV